MDGCSGFEELMLLQGIQETQSGSLMQFWGYKPTPGKPIERLSGSLRRRFGPF